MAGVLYMYTFMVKNFIATPFFNFVLSSLLSEMAIILDENESQKPRLLLIIYLCCIHSFIHSFIQQSFTEKLLTTRLCLFSGD